MEQTQSAGEDGRITPGRDAANSLLDRGAKVSLAGLEKRFDLIGAVAGISLEIGSGEFLTLLGPSGSGKTTTLMMIAGFETPTGGDIAIDGRSVIGTPPHKRNIGMVFQNYALFPHLTVAENIAFPLKQRGMDRAARARLVTDSLAMVRLPGYQARYPRQLSGGQQQRVALARAIVFQPRLLLMDEPLGALDKQLRESLQLEMRRLHAELGITFIYVTHDQEEALIMSDRIAVMNEGRIAQVGPPEALYDRPCDRFVAAFIGESNFLPGVARGMEDGMVVADCGGTILRAIAAAPMSPGNPLTLTVRPERMHFANGVAEDAAGQNAMRATVTEAVFAGERCRYLLRCADGTALVLKEPSRAATRRRQVGEELRIAWSVADTVVV
ncbi:MAG TPA: ABC transporter ATP-binding protein [Acetobacteraceae bacterium]|nr:ABC transporter ATP-binding protein [Acetobacteraceae bacterium]